MFSKTFQSLVLQTHIYLKTKVIKDLYVGLICSTVWDQRSIEIRVKTHATKLLDTTSFPEPVLGRACGSLSRSDYTPNDMPGRWQREPNEGIQCHALFKPHFMGSAVPLWKKQKKVQSLSVAAARQLSVLVYLLGLHVYTQRATQCRVGVRPPRRSKLTCLANFMR